MSEDEINRIIAAMEGQFADEIANLFAAAAHMTQAQFYAGCAKWLAEHSGQFSVTTVDGVRCVTMPEAVLGKLMDAAGDQVANSISIASGMVATPMMFLREDAIEELAIWGSVISVLANEAAKRDGMPHDEPNDQPNGDLS